MTVHALLLPRTYDVERLQADFHRLAHLPRHPQPGQYHDGEWTGISLHAAGGRQDSAAPWDVSVEEYRETQALQHAPYLKEVLNGLECPKTVVRLLALPPGGEIREHRDDDCSFQIGTLRLHVPIITHPDVSFFIDGKRCEWKEGELWYGDFSLPHRVKNESSITRIHMVIDVLINDFLLGLFPPEYVEAQRQRGPIALHRPRPAALDPRALERFECSFTLPPGLLLEGSDATTASVRLVEGKLQVVLGDTPLFGLEPASDTTLNVVGLPPGYRIDCEFSEGRISGATLHLGGDAIPVSITREPRS